MADGVSPGLGADRAGASAWSRAKTGDTPSLKPAFWAAGLFSLAFNVLLLVSPLYMLQVYDRVLTSGSRETLILVTVMAVALLGVFVAADAGRRRVFSLIGKAVGERLEAPVFAAGMRAGGSGRKLETAAADLGRVQALFSAGTVQPVFDAPFVPMFAALVFLVHPLLGTLTVGGAVFLVLLAVAAERSAKPALERAALKDRAAAGFLGGVSRQYAAIRTMGMAEAVERRWRDLRSRGLEEGMEAGRTANLYGGVSRSARQVLQMLILGVAAWLVLRQEISSGAIIASSILSGRCLGPIDQAIGSWKPFMQGRQAWRNLNALLAGAPSSTTGTALPRPEARLALQGAAVGFPGAAQPLLPPLTFTVEPGRVLLVLGQSGQGKTSLLQMLSGAWAPSAGSVSLGGRDLHGWDAGDRGRYVGYLPQHINLLPGSARENIERFSGGAPEAVFAAAERIGAHTMILGLRDGYDTEVGGEGGVSAGQRQTIGLARALYGDPAVLFLDEPTAHSDTQSVGRLLELLRQWKAQGRAAVVASHDLRLLNVADTVLDLRDGKASLVERDAYARALAAATPGPALHKVAS